MTLTLQPGDQVFGFAGFGMSTLAEYQCISEAGSDGLETALARR
jgi:hypothetical protein